MDLKSNILVIPRGQQYVGSTPSGAPGLRWTTKYGIVGANAFGLPVTLDGLNEQGLQVGLFYFPDYAKYNQVAPQDARRTLAPWELGVFLLGTCSNVGEAVQAAGEVLVGDVVQKDLGIVPPAHYIVSDTAGNCAVLEYIDGQLKVHANPLGVMSNSPSFDWHMTNLSNYVNLSVNNVPQIDVKGTEIKGLGQGSGMLGLPGDFTPPSRFVRAVAFAESAVPVDSAREGVLQAFHLLNQFDIPKGAARGKENGQAAADYTLWTAVSDLSNRRYYYRTFENSRIRMVDLKGVDFNAQEIKTISMSGEEQIEDVSGQAK
jgi:choloylglycine hydrolase